MFPYIKTPKKIKFPILLNAVVKAHIQRTSGSYDEAPEDNSEYEVLQVFINKNALKTYIFDDLILQQVEQDINESGVSFHEVEIDLHVIVTSEGVFYEDIFRNKFDIAPFLTDEEIEEIDKIMIENGLFETEELIEKHRLISENSMREIILNFADDVKRIFLDVQKKYAD